MLFDQTQIKKNCLKKFEVGDTITVFDGSYSLIISSTDSSSKHTSGDYLKTRRLQIIAKLSRNVGFPCHVYGQNKKEKDMENDLIVVDLDNNDIIFLQARFCTKVKYEKQKCSKCGNLYHKKIEI